MLAIMASADEILHSAWSEDSCLAAQKG